MNRDGMPNALYAHTRLGLKPPKEVYMGIDPGQKGGWCVLGFDAGPLPWSGKDLDGRALASIIRCNGVTSAVIEKAQAMPKQGVTSMFSYGYGAGKIAGILEALGVPYRLVTPQAWKKLILAGTAKDKTAAISYVRRWYPAIDLMPGKKRTPHDGIADAVCLAEWAKKTS